MKRMVEFRLSSAGGKDKHKENAKAKGHALTSIIYVMSDIVMVGGASLISSTFGRQSNEFLLEQMQRIRRHDSDGGSGRKHGALHDQTAKYEKRLELVRFETKSTAKKSAEIHIHERQRAGQHTMKCQQLYHDEREPRLSTDQQKKDIVEESSRLMH